jgi:hypothetical protein
VTGFFDCIVALVVAGALDAFIGGRIARSWPGEEGRFLLRVYWWTLVLRHLLALVLNVYAESLAFAQMFWGDSATYDAGGYGLSLIWQGEIGSGLGAETMGRYGFYYFVGAIYYFFGRNQLLVQLLNGTIGALTVVVIHALAMRLFGAAVARRAAVMTAFFPCMVFWSAGMYKDPATILCIVVSRRFLCGEFSSSSVLFWP